MEFFLLADEYLVTITAFDEKLLAFFLKNNGNRKHVQVF